MDATKNQPSESTTATGPVEVSSAPIVTQSDRDEAGARVTTAPPIHEVHLIEYQIQAPTLLPAGRFSFQIENGGKEDHAFEIEGEAVHEKSMVLKRGDTTTLDVTLAPGTYTIYCPVDGHKDKGMKRTLTVHQ